MKVSILIPYYNRVDVFKRSLWLLSRQTYEDCEILMVDDGSEWGIDDFYNLRTYVGTENYIRYFQIRKPGSPPRSPNMAWRKAYQECVGDFIILTHPEVMVPFNAVELMLKHHDPERRSVPTQYCIPSYVQQNRIDRVDWEVDLSNLKKLPDFWSAQGPWGYTNDSAPTYHHHLSFSGQLREQWERIGFLPVVEDPIFQSDDSWLHARELEMRIPPKHLDYIEVYHQHHGRIYGNLGEKSPRIAAIEEADKIAAEEWNPC